MTCFKTKTAYDYMPRGEEWMWAAWIRDGERERERVEGSEGGCGSAVDAERKGERGYEASISCAEVVKPCLVAMEKE